MPSILIVDDERPIRATLREILEYEKLQVEEAETGAKALAVFKAKHFDTVLCDIKMPGMDGIELLSHFQAVNAEVPIIMVSGHGNIDTAVEAIKKGAYDYLAKPPDLNRLLVTVRNAIDRKGLVQENREIKRKLTTKSANQMIGNSSAVKEVAAMIEKVAPTEARVLILGPNGSGKELVARQLHALSPRNQQALVEVNCAAIPSELIESELFGHEKGSFTSAIKQRIGKFEQAHGSTLFLDEIGDMDLAAQAKVLRALQEGKITRVGGEKEIQVNVRMLAATNKDLEKEISEGRFREDLYHRLAVIKIEVPSLDERKTDIPLLVEHFLDQLAAEQGGTRRQIGKEALTALQARSWSGNIRQLRNTVERLTILGGGVISEDDVKRYA